MVLVLIAMAMRILISRWFHLLRALVALVLPPIHQLQLQILSRLLLLLKPEVALLDEGYDRLS